MITTIAELREEYPFEDENAFVRIEADVLTKRPRLTVVIIDDDKDLDVTLSRVMRNED